MEPAIIVALIALCGTVAVPVVNAIIDRRKEARKEKAAKKEKEAEQEAKRAAAEEARRIELQKAQSELAWRTEVKELINPVAKDVKDIKNDVDKLTEAAVLGFRVDLKLMRDRVVDLGIAADVGEKSTWKTIYKKYYRFGGNNFHDFVDGWGVEMGFTEEQLAQFRREVQEGNMD